MQPKARKALTEMVNVYYANFGSVGSTLSDSLLAGTIGRLQQIAATNTNATAAYNILFSRLLD